MENIGIDIGNYKTTTASSKENGKILYDELSKRSIYTVLELTEPKRTFGNNVAGASKKNVLVRHRNFRDTDLGLCSMFLSYVGRVVQLNTSAVPVVTLAVPFFYGQKERRSLLSAMHTHQPVALLHDITGVALAYALKKEGSKKFIIVDFGHSKTTAGLFECTEEFKTHKILGIQRGAQEIDEGVLNLLISKVSQEIRQRVDEKVLRERVLGKVAYIKQVLNSMENVQVYVEIGEDTVPLKINREEYENIAKDLVGVVKEFLEGVKESMGNEHVQVAGGNSNNYLVKQVLSGVFENVGVALNADESCAVGVALGGAVSVFGARNNFKVFDVLNRKISLQMDGEPVLLFAEDTPVPSAALNVTYKRKGSFRVKVLDENEEVGYIEIQAEGEGQPQTQITFSVDKAGLVQSSLPMVVPAAAVNLKELESQYRQKEEEAEAIGNIRNKMESMFMGLPGLLKEYNLTKEESEKLEGLSEEFLCSGIQDSLKAEEGRKNESLEKLNFIKKKIEEAWEEKKGKIKNLIFKMEEVLARSGAVYTPTVYKMHGMVFKAKEMLKKMVVDLYELKVVFDFDVDEFKGEVDKVVLAAESELMAKEIEKAQREKAAHEAAAKAAEDAAKAENENAAKAENENAAKAESGEPVNETAGEPTTPPEDAQAEKEGTQETHGDSQAE